MMRRVLAIICLLTMIVGCNKPNTEPESIDPIYKDLLVDYSNTQKEAEEAEKRVAELKEGLEKVVPQTGQNKKAFAQYFDAKNKLAAIKQHVEFLRVRSNSRKYEARRLYISAFEKGLPWPNPQEYTNYVAQKELKTRSRNWRDRTPAYDAIKASKEKGGKAEGEAKESSH